jgi:adenine-specific DNA-methyltransferase
MMEKMKMHSPNLAQENITRIRELFPGCVTETQGEDGQLKLAVDFDQLKQELSESIVEGPRERYHLNWPGKREALLTANAPIAKTLRPCREESVNFDTTKNLFIEGDNLEALKLLQETYLSEVKLIYIDPPYNTGTNLIYKNDYSVNEKEYLLRSGQLLADGGKLVANLQSNGRFHSDWLTMIYSRLKVAKNLLSEDGILICAIDENEFSNLSIVIKEIFGEGSYCHDYVSVVHNPRGQQGTNFSYVNEYLIFVYPKGTKKYLADFKKDEVDARNLRDSGTESDRTDARNCFYPFIIKNGKITEIGDVPADTFHPSSSNVKLPDGSIQVWPMTDDGDEKKWRYARQSVDSIKQKIEPKMGRSSIQMIFNKDTGTMRSVWVNARYDSSEYGSKLLDELIPGAGFTYPKSLWAVYDCVFAATENNKDAIVMDFFAGSSTTAHAVMKLNADDGGNRIFIMVQAPQPCDSDTQPYKKGFTTIADISKERIRRAGNVILKEHNNEGWNKDIGFRVLKVDSSNMSDVYYTPDAIDQGQLHLFTDNIRPDRKPEDLLFQVLLDWGVNLTLPIRKQIVRVNKNEGKERKKSHLQEFEVYFVDENALIACFDSGVNEDLVKELARFEPLRVVFRDSGFVSDAVKINVEQIFKQMSPGTEVRSI